MAVPAFKRIMSYLWGENEDTAQEGYDDVDEIQNGYGYLEKKQNQLMFHNKLK